MEKIKKWKLIFLNSNPISYGKFYEFFDKIINKFGKSKQDLCEYRLTQVYDENKLPTEVFYYSNKSLAGNTTYKQTSMQEFTNSYNLEFICREKDNGIFKKKTKTKIFPYFGLSRVIVNSPYLINIKFGDYLALSNGLLMVIPRKLKRNFFK